MVGVKRRVIPSLVVAGLSLWFVPVDRAEEPVIWRPVRKRPPNSQECEVPQTSTIRQTSSESLKQSDEPQNLDDPEPITLHLDDVDVRKALEILSRQGSLNILISPGVSGRVTANLQGLDFDQALDAILKLCNLAAKREKGLIYVYTSGELSQLTEKDRKLSIRVYSLSYIKSTDLEKMITPFLSDKGRLVFTPPSMVGIKTDTDQKDTGGDSMAGGDVVVVQDYEPALEVIDDIVARLDVQPVQVLIEAVIMNVLLDKSKDLGVNFAVLDGAGRALTVIGNGAQINGAVGFTPAEVLTAGGKLVGSSTTSAPTGGFAANSNGIKFGFVDKDVTGFIRALESVGETKVLASPRLLVLNKQRAEIQLGDRLGYKTLTVTETASVEKVEFMKVGTQLRLRPFVSGDGMIRMEIHPERSSGRIDENGIPQTSSAEVTSNVLVPDGSTIVIGGLMETLDEDQQSGVPGLSRLRWVGALFRDKHKASTKRELIVLLTPRIWNPNVTQQANGAAAATPLEQKSTPNPGPRKPQNASGERQQAQRATLITPRGK